jgi:hypothetical protein
MAKSIITDAGRAAAAAAQINGLQIEIAAIAIGSGQSTPTVGATSLVSEVARFDITEASDLGNGVKSVSGMFEDPVDKVLVFTSNTMPLATNSEIRNLVTQSANGLTTYVAGTDYTVNEAAATITRLPGGAIGTGGTVRVSFRHYFSIGEVATILADGTLFSLASDPVDAIAFKSASIPGIPIEIQLGLLGLPLENITVTTSGTALNLFNAEKDLSNLTLHFTHAANHTRLLTALAANGIYA